MSSIPFHGGTLEHGLHTTTAPVIKCPTFRQRHSMLWEARNPAKGHTRRNTAAGIQTLFLYALDTKATCSHTFSSNVPTASLPEVFVTSSSGSFPPFSSWLQCHLFRVIFLPSSKLVLPTHAFPLPVYHTVSFLSTDCHLNVLGSLIIVTCPSPLQQHCPVELSSLNEMF